MFNRTFAATGLLCLFGAVATAQIKDVGLPIVVPKGADVTFEASGEGKDIFKMLKQALNGNMTDPSAPSKDKLTVKTGAGNIDIKLDDLQPLLRHVHSMHAVVYATLPGDDPFARFEAQFKRDGMGKVLQRNGPHGLLIMRKTEKTDMYGIVVPEKDSVAVLRTAGAPGLGDFGQFLYEALSRAIQSATSKNKGE